MNFVLYASQNGLIYFTFIIINDSFKFQER